MTLDAAGANISIKIKTRPGRESAMRVRPAPSPSSRAVSTFVGQPYDAGGEAPFVCVLSAAGRLTSSLACFLVCRRRRRSGPASKSRAEAQVENSESFSAGPNVDVSLPISRPVFCLGIFSRFLALLLFYRVSCFLSPFLRGALPSSLPCFKGS